MSRGQCNELRAPIVQECIGSNQQGVDAVLVNSCESGREVAGGAGLKVDCFHSHGRIDSLAYLEVIDYRLRIEMKGWPTC
jgi:hypothetical protein